MPTAPPPVLLLCENEKSAQIDRRSLRDAGFPSVKVMTSGISAARMLAGLSKLDEKEIPQIVVCAQKLEDMDGEQFCAIIRQHPRLLGLPVLLIMSNDSEAEQLRTLGCGASALIGRPYSMDTFRQQMNSLAAAARPLDRLREAARATDTAAFDTALATYGILLRPARQPEDYFRVGMRCLKEKRWNHAISAFEHALRNAQIKAEAELGMAAAFRGKGDMIRFRGWLARASETFVRARRWHLARTAYARLLSHDPNAKNPFHSEAHRLIRQNAYDEAADTLVQSLAVMPRGQTGDRFARACFTADDPDAMFKALELSLTREDNLDVDFLSNEIRQNLDSLAREKREREKQHAAERKWQLSRAMAEKKKFQPIEVAEEPQISHVAGFSDDLSPETNTQSMNFDEPAMDEYSEEAAESDMVGAPLTRAEATSGFAKNHPRLNEFLSVIKLTWQLSRRYGKK